MPAILNIVVSCTDRKRLSVPLRLRARAISNLPLKQRFDRWWDRLSEAREQSVEAQDLYMGDHWQICRSLPEMAKAKGFRPKLWITSAGYGLIAADALLHPYSATFAAGQPDTVVTATEGAEGLRKWWSLLAGRQGPLRGAPRSLADVVRSAPRCHVLLVCSPTYVRALADDLVEAVDEMSDRDQFLIVTSPSSLSPALQAQVIPSEGRLRGLVGGALPSLHARVARKILGEVRRSRLSAPDVRARYQALLRRTPDLPRHDRIVLTDAQVHRYIKASLRQQPTLTRTPMLRELRDSGYACEQVRFRTIFQEADPHAA
jgi:hypothetical protein